MSRKSWSWNFIPYKNQTLRLFRTHSTGFCQREASWTCVVYYISCKNESFFFCCFKIAHKNPNSKMMLIKNVVVRVCRNQGSCRCLHMCYARQGDVLVGFLIVGAESVMDSFTCLWDPFSPAVLQQPALIWRYAPNLMVTFCTVFGWCTFEVCFFLKGERRVIELGEREMIGKVIWGEGGETSVVMSYIR